ncbi:uncharacterized protein LOC131294763 [Anopheles ziemanni]|uniref:uncharacterized protein LOC131265348 n=1 Tax=Anopheles coustani TaxID=139045 RepID=UPI002658573C|nr:uncharacterized protein LOC131265348 [Anopheles coustani]XP_058178790.1 uncharacterized protein LOC131294763 [Anopheles ziemanni]
MSSARCLNWSRPPPGRHPALRKQVSCSVEPSSSPSPAYYPAPTPASPASVSSAQTGRLGRTASLPGPEDFCHQFLVTGAIIHTNRFQNYHTYDQARRGGSASLVRQRTIVSDAAGGQLRRPASASVGQARTAVASQPDRSRGAVLCKQLSLDQSILVQSSFASGMATVASGGGGGGSEQGVEAALLVGDVGERSAWSGFNRKQQQRVGAGIKTDAELAGCKKGLKTGGGGGGKDSRINIKIFLGQTVQQQDSSDTGVSDTEGTTPGGPTMHQHNVSHGPKPAGMPAPSNACTEKCFLVRFRDLASTNLSSVSSTAGLGKLKPTNGTSTSASNNGQPSTAHGGTSAGGVSTGPNGNGNVGNSGGRNSSLAQRRAQFQANRQNSEAHDRRHPPLVRALSAPIRPADPDTSKFLQGKKKPRRRKVLREKDEYNICEEDEFSDEGDSRTSNGSGGTSNFIGAAAAAAAAGKPFPAGLPMRSRSVLGGACDIETLVSLLSSGGSDSEKEQEATQASSPGTTGSPSPTTGPPTFRQLQQQQQQFPSAHFPTKGRAPMLKKAGKSVSFQETDLKPSVATAGLNRDYRKPTFQPMVANRLRRTQQLVSTLNAFQLKDKDKSTEKDGGEEKHDRATKDKDNSSAENQTTSVSSTGASKPDSNKSTSTGSAAASNGDLQTPKEQECYRLFLKMSKKGLAVSYDTILRGMLTPTELRVLQKKKSREQRNNGAEENGGGVPEESSPENGAEGMTFEELRGLKELNFDRNSQPQAQDEPLLPQPTSPDPCDDKESGTEDEENTS